MLTEPIKLACLTRLVEPEDLMPTLEHMAAHIAEFAPLVPQFMKSMVNYGLEAGQQAGLAMEKFAKPLCVRRKTKKKV